MESRPVDAEQFKAGMRALAGAVNIITSTNAGHRYGMTATAVCSATADPPTVLACINKLATTHGAVAKRGVLRQRAARRGLELSTSFSGAQSGETRFKSRDWTRLATGSPVLIDALVSFDCRVVKRLSHGTPSSSARWSRCCSARRQAAALLRGPVRQARSLTSASRSPKAWITGVSRQKHPGRRRGELHRGRRA